ncbi:MAG TPA: hypothetical protein VMF13_10955 [Luteitalea sp.]|nr:hypothetical protein [Luteitalea sp.]
MAHGSSGVWDLLLAVRLREPQMERLGAPALAALPTEVRGLKNDGDDSVTSLHRQSLHALVEYLSRRITLPRIAMLGPSLPGVPEPPTNAVSSRVRRL